MAAARTRRGRRRAVPRPGAERRSPAAELISLVRIDLGFDPRNLLVRLITFPPETAKAPAEKHRIYTEVLERIASIPGVSAAAATTGIPPFGAGYTSALEIPGLQDDPQRFASVLFCTASYFPTIGCGSCKERRTTRGYQRKCPPCGGQPHACRAVLCRTRSGPTARRGHASGNGGRRHHAGGPRDRRRRRRRAQPRAT